MAFTSGPMGSIVLTDLRLRLRRPATLWLVVILSGMAYRVVPDPATGSALMVVDGARALYTSQVIATTTAVLGAMMLSFAGFYLTSNALRRDLLARTGGLIASTPVTSGAYLVGKWLGAAAYLAVVSGIYMLSVMAMHFLRGEGPLQPFTYLFTYLLILGPTIVVVAALALAFECVPLLAGRLGDVGYFFLWAVFLTLGAVGTDSGGASGLLDVMGVGYVMAQVRTATGAAHLTIGMIPFDGGQAAWVLPRLTLHLATLVPRLATASLAVPLLVVARLGFHRFDPARVHSRDQASGGRLIPHLSRLLKPLTRLVSSAGAVLVPTAPGMLRPILAETVMTLCQSPLMVLAWIGVALVTVMGTEPTVHRTLPIALAVILAVGLADLSTRDRAAGTQPMLFSMPGVKPGYARIKLGAATLLALLFCAPPALRILLGSPSAALSLVIAGGFMAALATALGFLTRTSKAFMGVFLLFLFLVFNGAQTPGLDFAGWNGVATGATRMSFFVAALVLGVVAEAKHRWDQARAG